MALLFEYGESKTVRFFGIDQRGQRGTYGLAETQKRAPQKEHHKKKLSGWESNPGYMRLGRCFPSS